MTGPVLMLVWLLIVDMNPAALSALFRGLWIDGVSRAGIGAGTMMLNSLILALGVAVLKGTFSLLAAYALVFFRLRYADLIFGVILLAMFFPVETRIIPTFEVAAGLGLLNSYSGMILPVVAGGLGVLVFRQFLQQLPVELMEAAKIDGAGPRRFLIDIVVPVSLPMIAAVFAILFVLGWNQYVWPIMITTTSQSHDTLVRGMEYAGYGGKDGLALALLALVPPTLIVLLLQRTLMRALASGIH